MDQERALCIFIIEYRNEYNKEVREMKRLLKIIISLLVTAAMFAIVHLVLQLNVFHFSSPNRFAAYLPAGLAILFGLIFYFIISSSVTDLLLSLIHI